MRITSIGCDAAGNASSDAFTAAGKPRNAISFALVVGEFGARRQFAVHDQESDLLELADIGDVENVVPAIVQIVARAADGA